MYVLNMYMYVFRTYIYLCIYIGKNVNQRHVDSVAMNTTIRYSNDFCQIMQTSFHPFLFFFFLFLHFFFLSLICICLNVLELFPSTRISCSTITHTHDHRVIVSSIMLLSCITYVAKYISHVDYRYVDNNIMRC